MVLLKTELYFSCYYCYSDGFSSSRYQIYSNQKRHGSVVSYQSSSSSSDADEMDSVFVLPSCR